MEFVNNLFVETEDIYNPFFEQVFDNPLLLQEILYHVIGKDNTLDDCLMSEIKNFRLVSKYWLDAVSRILKREKYNLKKLSLGPDESQDKTEIKKQLAEKKLLLKSAVNLFSSPDHLAHISVIPFRLVVSKTIFPEELYTFLDLLKSCGPSVTLLFVELSKNMQIPMLDSYLPLSLPNLSDFGLLRSTPGIEYVTQMGRKGGNECNIEAFVQAVLDGTEKLNQINFTCGVGVSNNFKNIRLPSTLSGVTLSTPELDILIYSQLPYLQTLDIEINLEVGAPPIEKELISKILQKYRQTLFYFNLNCYGFTPSVKLPIMEELWYLEINAKNYIWESSSSNVDIEKCLPVLNNVTLNIDEETSWLQWLGNGHKLETVNRLQILKRWSSNEMEMKMIAQTFPNLESLNIRVNFKGMRVLFREMKQLRILTLFFTGEFWRNNLIWTSTLLGITSRELRRVCALLNSGNVSWRVVKLKRKENAVSILSLTELTQLKIVYKPQDRQHVTFPNLVCFLGLLKMTNLKKLIFEGFMKPSTQVIEMWTK